MAREIVIRSSSRRVSEFAKVAKNSSYLCARRCEQGVRITIIRIRVYKTQERKNTQPNPLEIYVLLIYENTTLYIIRTRAQYLCTVGRVSDKSLFTFFCTYYHFCIIRSRYLRRRVLERSEKKKERFRRAEDGIAISVCHTAQMDDTIMYTVLKSLSG